MKTAFKTGDEVVVLSGDHKGKKGKLLKVDRRNDRVLVEGLNMLSHYTRKSDKNPHGGIQKKEGFIHISNVERSAAAPKASKKKEASK